MKKIVSILVILTVLITSLSVVFGYYGVPDHLNYNVTPRADGNNYPYYHIIKEYRYDNGNLFSVVLRIYLFNYNNIKLYSGNFDGNYEIKVDNLIAGVKYQVWGSVLYYNGNDRTEKWSYQKSGSINYESNELENIGNYIYTGIEYKREIIDCNYDLKYEDGMSYIPPEKEFARIVIPNLGAVIDGSPSKLYYHFENFQPGQLFGYEKARFENGNWRTYDISYDNISFNNGIFDETAELDTQKYHYISVDDEVWLDGENRIRIFKAGSNSTDGIVAETKFFIQGMPTSELVIQGFLDGQSLNYPPTLKIYKKNYQACDIWLNDDKFYSLGPEDIDSLLLNIYKDKVQLGKNIITVKDANGEVLQEKIFYMYPNSSGEVNENPNKENFDRTRDLPKFDIFNPATWFVPIIQAFQKVLEPVNSVSQLFSSVYSFLPLEWVVLGVIAISLGIFLRILGR